MVYRKIQWSLHVQAKMRQYGFSKSKLLQLLYKPERIEKGIADGTVAVMKTKKVFNFKAYKKPAQADNLGEVRPFRRPPGEIWLMYRDTATDRKIISAWFYPGVSKPGEPIPIPDEIRREITFIA